MPKLGLNVDHVATVRNARGELYPSVIEVALLATSSGADLITAHLREDRRHVNDADIQLLRHTLKTPLNLEIAPTTEMIQIASTIKPDYVCLVPEKRQEISTESGLNLFNNTDELAKFINILHSNDIKVSLFIDPDKKQVQLAKELNADIIELHTGAYAKIQHRPQFSKEFMQIKEMMYEAHSLGLLVNAGHGLDYHNVRHIAMLEHINELHIGFAIIAQSIIFGISNAVTTIKNLII